ncbi:MAG: hypothetical protein WCJ13_11050 [Coriobacteriia bacterium]
MPHSKVATGAPREPELRGVKALMGRHAWIAPMTVSVLLASLTFSWAISLYSRPPILHDALGYTMTAQRLLSTHVFSFYGQDGVPDASVTPGYVLFLAGIYGAHPRSADVTATAAAVQPTVQGVQFAMILAVVGFIAGCGFLLGGRKLAYLSGFLAALYLPFAWGVPVALSETLAATLAALQLLLALLLARKNAHRMLGLAVGIGAVSAALALVRPVSAAWIVMPFIYLAVRRTFSWREFGRLLSVSMVVFVLIMGVWWVRNVVTLHRFVVLSEGAGNPAFVSTGGEPLTVDEQAVADAAAETGKDWQGAVAHYRIGRQLSADPMGLIRARAGKAAEVLQMPWVEPNDALYEQVNSPGIPHIGDDPFPRGVNPVLRPVVKFVVGYQAFLLLAALVGLLFIRRSPRLALVASVPIYFMLVHSVTLFINRYFYPAMPAVILLAAAGVYGLVHVAVLLTRKFAPGSARRG